MGWCIDSRGERARGRSGGVTAGVLDVKLDNSQASTQAPAHASTQSHDV